MSGRWRMFMADPSANAAMARGDLKAAHDSFLQIAESGQVEYFYRCARCVLWEGEVAAASKLLERYNTSGGFGRIVEARRITIEAGVAALQGRTAEARGLYREALGIWRTSHCVWDEALTGLDMAELLGPAEREVAEVVASTRAILERLGARPYLARLDAAISAPHSTLRPAPVAQREEIAVPD
jgi:hypothetical protein